MKRTQWLSWCAVSLLVACGGQDDSQVDGSAGAGGGGGAGGALVDASGASARDANRSATEAASSSDAGAAAERASAPDAASAADTSITGDELTVGDASTIGDGGAGIEGAADPDGDLPGELDGTVRAEGSIDFGSLRDAAGGLIDPNMVPPRPPTF